MELPNYYLADLPNEATLSIQMVHEAAATLRRNREHYLRGKSVAQIISTICGAAAEWLDPGNEFRTLALNNVEKSGFPREILAQGLDAFFTQVTKPNLEALIQQDLGLATRLEAFGSTLWEEQNDRASLAQGPELIVHVTGGKLPTPVFTSMIFGLLVRSAQFLKCASGTSFLPRLFAHSLYRLDPKLGACLEIAEWKGGNTALEDALFSEAKLVTAMGDDETIRSIRDRLPIGVRLAGYGHKVSFGFIAHEALSGFSSNKLVARAADDVIAWNQLGCLSPHIFYVEMGGGTSPAQFAELLAEELRKRENTHPRGPVGVAEASNIASRRSFYAVRAAHDAGTKLWGSDQSSAWTVVFENEPQFQFSCLHRFIYIKAVGSLHQALCAADQVQTKVSTVGIAALENRTPAIAQQLANWGVTRICPIGQMQNPPLTWRHDGRPALGDLITWTDWEQ
jgi:hypothetical protein